MAGSKSLPKEMADHLKSELEALIALKFTKPDGEPWPEIPMAEALGISQSQLNAMRKGKNAGVGGLLAVSKHSGKSINELLGPTAPQPVTYDPDVKAVFVLVDKLMKVLAKNIVFGEKNPATKIRAEILKRLEGSPYGHPALRPTEVTGIMEPPKAKQTTTPEERAPRSRRKTA